MIALIEIIQKSSEFLEKKGVESPRLNAEHLIAFGLGLKRMEVYLQFERPLTDEELERLRTLVRRRGQREPLQYILGSVDFCGLTLQVDPGVLIPRPETEELAEWLASQHPPPSRILDLGCGSGALALALAAAFPLSEVLGIDDSPAALVLAGENARQLKGRSPIRLKRSHWFESVVGTYDWIVSNPPYLSEDEWEESSPEVRDFEPRQALVSGDNGYADLLTILRQAGSYLNRDGLLALEAGVDQHGRLITEARSFGWGSVESRQDFSGRDRFLILREPPTGNV